MRMRVEAPAWSDPGFQAEPRAMSLVRHHSSRYSVGIGCGLPYGRDMNDAHIALLTSPERSRYLEANLLPWVLARIGDHADRADVLEVGPGPGRMTDLLAPLVDRLTALEVDEGLARALASRFEGTNVEVVHGDGTAMNFHADRFGAVFCFTMLHHIPSPDLQDRLFAEMCRVARSGGQVIGVDSLDTAQLREFHIDDTWVPVDLETLGARLATAGLVDVTVEAWEAPTRVGPKVRFTATKP